MLQEERPVYIAVYLVQKGIVNSTAAGAALENHLGFKLRGATHEPAKDSQNSELLGVEFSCEPGQSLQEIVKTIKRTLELTYKDWGLKAASLHPTGTSDQLPGDQVSIVWLPRIVYSVSRNGMIKKL